MDTELVTQLIILATAIVGLYKAATYKPEGFSEQKSNDGEPHPLADLLTGLLSFAGVFAFMLIMPAFIWAFTTITSNIGKSSDESTPTPQYSVPFKIFDNPSDLEIMLVAASQIPYENSRGSALNEVVEKSLSKCEINIALAAVIAVPYENSRGSTLKKVMETIDSGKCNKKP